MGENEEAFGEMMIKRQKIKRKRERADKDESTHGRPRKEGGGKQVSKLGKAKLKGMRWIRSGNAFLKTAKVFH